GSLVVCAAATPAPELFVRPLAGGSVRRLTASGHGFEYPQPLPDGSLLAETFPRTLRPQIVIVPHAGGDPVPFADGQAPALTPDGAQIVYTLDHAVLTRPSMGGPVRRVTDAPGQVLRMTGGADGQV